MKSLVMVVVCTVASSAHAGRVVGIVATGEQTRQPGVEAEAIGWAKQHSLDVTPTALDPEARERLVDCTVLDDQECTTDLINKHARAPEILYVYVHAAGNGRTFDIDVTWYSRGNDPQHDTLHCGACNDQVTRRALPELLDRLAGRARPPVVAEAPPAAPPTPPTPPTPPNKISAQSASEESPANKRWHLGAALSAFVPRGALDPGGGVATRATYALDRLWSVAAIADWTHTGRDGPMLLSPALFPRSRGTLDETSDLVTLGLGAAARIVRFGNVAITTGVAVGVQGSRAHLAAYGMSHVKNSVGPAATLELAVEGSATPLAWRAAIAWREAHRNLGDAHPLADETTSGLLLGVGFDW